MKNIVFEFFLHIIVPLDHEKRKAFYDMEALLDLSDDGLIHIKF